MTLDFGGPSAATIVGGFGGQWYTVTISGNGGRPTSRRSRHAGQRRFPRRWRCCGFTLANGFAFTAGRNMARGFVSSAVATNRAVYGSNDYEWACY